jgi:hypothetical protein
MRALISVVAVIMAPSFGQAQQSTRTDEEILAQAEAAFQRGVEHKTRFLLARTHFSHAADRYIELHERRVRNPALYRSLGNAALLADRWPEAIWAYRVGLKLDPNDAIMREHLAFVRAKVLYPPSGEGRLDADTWPAWLHRPTLLEAWCVFAVCYAAALFTATLGFIRRRRGAERNLTGLWLIVVLELLIALVAGIALWHEQGQLDLDHRIPVVIIAENTAFYQGNATSYPQYAALPMLPRGMEARRIHQRGNWVQIRLSTGEVGWLPRDRVLVVQ